MFVSKSSPNLEENPVRQRHKKNNVNQSMSSQHTGNPSVTDRAEGLLGHFGNVAYMMLFLQDKPKKCVPTSGEERPQQAET